jgi:2',3'-cyclic-nucleotide 2'-phosphodiesterase (5'-nucleotidase family)
VTRFFRFSAFAALALIHVSCLPLLPGEDIDLSGQQVKLTLLHTSDIHSRLLPYDFNPAKTDVDLGLIPEAGPFGGATRLASLVKRERARSDRVVHLDSGDPFQGAPIFNANLGEVEYKFMSLLKVTAAAIGNHEFDAGASNFTQKARDFARFPLLAANYLWEDWGQPNSNQTALYTQPYTITNIGGLRVGVIGMGNISSLNSIVYSPNSMQVKAIEPNEAARGYVEFLRPSVDLILVTSHAGLTEDQQLVEGYDAYYEWGIAKAFVQRAANPWVLQEWYGTVNDDASVVRVTIPGVEGIDAILGGHLHIVLNPPQLLTDPAGRKVILSHGGSFSKYLIRMDTVVQMPAKGADTSEGAEILTHDFKVYPLDALWCSDAMHAYYSSKFWNTGDFRKDSQVQAAITECTNQEDLDTTQLLQKYITDLDSRFELTAVFGYAPADIARRNSSSGGDSPLGNITADSMRTRRGVEAEVAVTNSLGIRDNLYAGPLSDESMFNVFPFENTINVMFLSGREMQEMFDFITTRSNDRGCISQAQVSGARFTMDCAQVQLNNLLTLCDPKGTASECPNDRDTGRNPWQCVEDSTQPGVGHCYAHPGESITINGQTLQENETYRVAVNDYIAQGGSGFLVLKRNTTRVETGISLRDSLIGYMKNDCTCEDILAAKLDANGNITGANGQTCGNRDATNPAHWIVDPLVVSYCQGAKDFADQLTAHTGSACSCAQAFRGDATVCTANGALADQAGACLSSLPAGPVLGHCGCRDALAGKPECGNLTHAVRDFCENPMKMPVAIGAEDGRIARRVK